MAKILVVDDEAAIRNSLKNILENEKYIVDEAVDGMDGLVKFRKGNYDVIILDIKMPNMDGMDVLDRIKTINDEIPVIVFSGHADINTAVEAVKKGAFDFITKPIDLNRLLITIRNAVDFKVVKAETVTLKARVRKYKTQEIIGESKAVMIVKNMIDRVADSDAKILITGPNGSGKELVARWVHEKSNRKNKPIIEVNCAAIPSELIESELFGHEKGSFTGAYKKKIGKFELANGGTLFLDEVGDMSLDAQAKVLRALQDGKITRVGGDKPIRVDVRVVAATNKNINDAIDNHQFREDLYHRLSVIEIKVPSLNERAEDIPILVDYFNKLISKETGRSLKPIDADVYNALKNINWTGNIRELRNVVERLIILSKDKITLEDVMLYVSKPTREVIK